MEFIEKEKLTPSTEAPKIKIKDLEIINEDLSYSKFKFFLASAFEYLNLKNNYEAKARKKN
jgi:hypothetical protein